MRKEQERRAWVAPKIVGQKTPAYCACQVLYPSSVAKHSESELINSMRFCLRRIKNGQETSEAVVYLQRAKLTPPFFILRKPEGRGEKAARRPKKARLYVQYTLRFFRSRIVFSLAQNPR